MPTGLNKKEDLLNQLQLVGGKSRGAFRAMLPEGQMEFLTRNLHMSLNIITIAGIFNVIENNSGLAKKMLVGIFAV